MSVALYTPSSSQIVHEARVDFRQRVIQPMIHIVQYDKSLPIIAVELYSDGQKWPLPETVTTVKVRWGKRDHTYVYTDVLGCNADRTVVYIEIIEQMTVFYGEHNPVLEVTIGDTLACSSYIPFYIDRNPIQRDDIESQIVPSVLDQIYAAIALKQDTLVSGTNIKTINGQSILGSGDITISGGGTTVEAITTYSASLGVALAGLKIGDSNYRLLPLGTVGYSCDIAIGIESSANEGGTYSCISIGRNSKSKYGGSVAIGDGSQSYSEYSVAIGSSAKVNSDNISDHFSVSYATAIGCWSIANGKVSTALGAFSKAIAFGSVALGYRTIATISEVVSLYGHEAGSGGTNAQHNKTILLRDPEKIFFANEDSTSTTDTYTALSQFTSGKTLKDYLDAKQATLVAGTNITLLTNADGTVTINASGGSQVPMGTMYGNNALAIGTSSVAGTSGYSYDAVAYGNSAKSTGSRSTAIGNSANASDTYASVFGYDARAGMYSVVVGSSSQADQFSVVVGHSARTGSYSNYNVVIGLSAAISASSCHYNVVIGANAASKCSESIAIGRYSQSYINGWVVFDPVKGSGAWVSGRVITAFDPSKIFFRNEMVDNTKTTQAAYTNGHTLADYMFAYATDAEIEAIFN